MPRLNWNVSGERFYETGIDRGVLFIDNLGYAWSGLVSVSETASGGDARPFYIDGIKYLNLAAAEEFEATIEAFSSPSQFAACDGIVSIYNGLMVTQQPRKSFGLSYRTKVGNDTDGPDFGHKIHLVYNALAAPTERTYKTQEASIDLEPLSWDITTLPPALTGYRPTAHFVIDSRYTPEATWLSLEDILYGNDALGSAMPTVLDLVAMFSV